MKCQKCGAEMDFIQGVTTHYRMEQFHCPKCHHTIVVAGGKIHEGYIAEHWYQTDFGADVVYYIENK